MDIDTSVTDNKGSGGRRSKLLDLPPEIRHCIVRQNVYGKGDRSNLRLVCRALDDIAKPLVLASLSLSNLTLSQLKELASSQSGFEDHSKHLHFHGYCRRGSQDQIRVVAGLPCMVDAQSVRELEDAVCRIIKKLKKVLFVDLASYPPLGSSRLVAEAIGMLPLLEGVQWLMLGVTEQTLAAVTSALSNLKSLTIHSGFPAVPDSAMEEHLAVLMAKCPNLSRIHISVDTPYSLDQQKKFKCYNLTSIVTPITTRPNFQPSVRYLNASSLVILPTRPCLSYLKCLTSLRMSTVGQSDSIWPALHTSGIILEDLIVDAVTERLIEYLLGYRGLKTFQADGTSEMGVDVNNPLPQPDRQQVARLFDEALPHHNQSLRLLGIWFTEDSWGTGSADECWALNAKQLEKLGRLSNLERLGVTVCVDWHGVGVHLSVAEILTYIFTRLSSSLHEVQIRCSIPGLSGGQRIQFAVADYEFKRPPSNIHACLMTPSPWFIAFDHSKQVYKFETTDQSVLEKLAKRRPSIARALLLQGGIPAYVVER